MFFGSTARQIAMRLPDMGDALGAGRRLRAAFYDHLAEQTAQPGPVPFDALPSQQAIAQARAARTHAHVIVEDPYWLHVLAVGAPIAWHTIDEALGLLADAPSPEWLRRMGREDWGAAPTEMMYLAFETDYAHAVAEELLRDSSAPRVALGSDWVLWRRLCEDLVLAWRDAVPHLDGPILSVPVTGKGLATFRTVVRYRPLLPSTRSRYERQVELVSLRLSQLGRFTVKFVAEVGSEGRAPGPPDPAL